MAFKRLRGLLDRSLAVVAVTTTGAHVQSSDDTNAAALLVSQVDSTGAAIGTANPLPVQDCNASGAISDTNPKRVAGKIIAPSANFTRPADTTAYASGDLVANSTTAGSVTPLSFAVGTSVDGMIRRIRLRKSGTSTTNASFRVHFYSASPTPANGDNGVWSTDGVANYIGAADVTVDKAFTDGAHGSGIPNNGAEMNFADLTTVYALVEARAAYTPSSGEVFTVALETHVY